jgi:hypothetical protein
MLHRQVPHPHFFVKFKPLTLDDQMGDLNTLANAAKDAGFDYEKAWPTLDEAGQRLAEIRTLVKNRVLNKTNRTLLANAIDALHKLLIDPSSLLADTPDMFQNEFRKRAMTLTTQYLEFSLDVLPKTGPEKDQYLDMLLDKLINPVRGQPNLWGQYSLLMTESVKRFENLRMSVTRPQDRTEPEPTIPQDRTEPEPTLPQDRRGPEPTLPQDRRGPEPTLPQDRRGPEPTIPPIPLYPGYHPQFPPQSQNVQPGYPPHPQYYPPTYDRPLYLPGNEQPQGRTDYRFSREFYVPQPYQKSGPQQQYRPPPSGLGGLQSTTVLNKPVPPARALLPVYRPTPRPFKTPFSNEEDAEERRLMALARRELRGIRRHPARQMQTRTEVDNDNFSESEKVRRNEDMDVEITNESPKRPLSVGSNEDLALKRKRTDEGIQPVTHKRSLSREQSYQEVAKQHAADEQYLSKGAVQLEEHQHNPSPNQHNPNPAPTPIQTDDDRMTLPRGPPLRTRSRAQVGLEEILTPRLERLLSPDPTRHMSAPPPRERSPDRDGWRRNHHLVVHRDIASTPPEPRGPFHISNRVSVIPPGGNALGARSPELLPHEQAERPAFEHIRPLEGYDEVKAIVPRPVLRIPANASETQRLFLNASNMPRFMTQHDKIYQRRHVQRREFYVHTRTALIAKASSLSHKHEDGRITFGRYFNLTREELYEIHQYVKFMGGQESTGPRTMIRLVFRETNGENRDPFKHSWPENSTVILNGRYLMTSMVRNISFSRLTVAHSSLHFT